MPSISPYVRAFRKSSAPVELVGPANGATVADQVTFDWTELLLTNRKPAYNVNQEALFYQVQVNTSPDFAPSTEVHTSPRLDATLYTAPNDVLPEGQLYWRVQSFDGTRNPLTVSETRLVNKSSARPVLQEPADGSTIGSQLVAALGGRGLHRGVRGGGLQEPGPADQRRQPLSSASGFAPTRSPRPTSLLGGPNFGWRVRRLSAAPAVPVRGPQRTTPNFAASSTAAPPRTWPTPPTAPCSPTARRHALASRRRRRRLPGRHLRVALVQHASTRSAITVMTAFAPVKSVSGGYLLLAGDRHHRRRLDAADPGHLGNLVLQDRLVDEG